MPDRVSSQEYRAPRLFVERPLAMRDPTPLTPDQARYLRNVMRRDAGAPVLAFNGQDGEWRCRLHLEGRRDAWLEPEAQIRPQTVPGVGPVVIFAAVKRGPTELIVEKATEQGASTLQPVVTARANVDRLKEDRLRRIAIEAAEQCGRLDIPEIEPLAPLDTVLAAWPADRTLIVGDESGQAPPALHSLNGARPGAFGLLVGPEGGFARGELDAFDQFDFVRKVGLGPRILRAETAVIAGLALAQAVLGDWGSAPGAPE